MKPAWSLVGYTCTIVLCWLKYKQELCERRLRPVYAYAQVGQSHAISAIYSYKFAKDVPLVAFIQLQLKFPDKKANKKTYVYRRSQSTSPTYRS